MADYSHFHFSLWTLSGSCSSSFWFLDFFFAVKWQKVKLDEQRWRQFLASLEPSETEQVSWKALALFHCAFHAFLAPLVCSVKGPMWSWPKGPKGLCIQWQNFCNFLWNFCNSVGKHSCTCSSGDRHIIIFFGDIIKNTEMGWRWTVDFFLLWSKILWICCLMMYWIYVSWFLWVWLSG